MRAGCIAVAGFLGVAAAAAESPPKMPPSPVAGADSSTFAGMSTLADTLAALDSCFARVEPTRRELASEDLGLFDELVAAARETYDFGDIEAAVLLIEDAWMLAGNRAP